ncbi:MAG TPA: protein-L-isoaspartate(D-aspartate) O-methyltransferase [Ignavibacteria bacterium]|nr:protein-L-isoaspartate(D-aspartate) O-methyltransferase [Ignavibacteria bacterium]
MDLNSLHRKELIEKLVTSGIKDKDVLRAIGQVRRELFVKEEFKKYSYENIALPLDSNQTISQPYTVAYMTELLGIKPGDKVLEIGTGSGYQSAVLFELGAEVYSIERIKALHESAKEKLYRTGYKVRLKNDDGTKGWIEYAPFDKIIVTAGSPRIPRQLLEQLCIGGKMVIPVGDEESQKLLLVKKSESEDKNDNEPKYKYKTLEDFKFVPLIGEEGWSIIN